MQYSLIEIPEMAIYNAQFACRYCSREISDAWDEREINRIIIWSLFHPSAFIS